MKYLVVDAALGGTGIRDKYNGGYLDPEVLGLSSQIVKRLSVWLSDYEQEQYNGYENPIKIDDLDKEGKLIALEIKNYITEVKLEYYSDANLSSELI